MQLWQEVDLPLDEHCVRNSVVYQAIVKVTGTKNNRRRSNAYDDSAVFKPKDEEQYIGITGGTFKQRYYSHKNSFKDPDKRTATTLSEYVWKLKDHRFKFEISWKIIARAKAYSPATKECNLCTKEKFYFLYKPDMCSLNKRNEITSCCPHRRKYIIGNRK